MKMITGPEQLNLIDNILELRKLVWPEFIRLPPQQVRKYYEAYPDFQHSLISESGELMAVANSLPMSWNGELKDLPSEGLSNVLEKLGDFKQGKANLLCGISMSIHPKFQKQGMSRVLIKTLKESALKKEMKTLVLPLRPTEKADYPKMPMDEYIQLRRIDGQLLDPWLRVHLSMGAKIIKVCPDSAVVQASLDEWEKWTGIKIEGGESTFPGGLVPLIVNRELNQGTYTEPNVWVAY